MPLRERLAAGLQSIITRAGTPIRVQYFEHVYDDVYDDSSILTQSGGDLWTSGVILPILQSNSSEAILVEQGKLLLDDKKLFVHGSLTFVGSELTASIRLGSPGNESDKQYSLLNFNRRVEVSNTPIYRQVYIRAIGGTGSLYGLQ